MITKRKCSKTRTFTQVDADINRASINESYITSFQKTDNLLGKKEGGRN